MMISKFSKNKFLKIIIYFILLILTLKFLYFSAVGLGLFISKQKEFKGEKKYKIYITTGRIHVDFILPYSTDVIRWDNFIHLSDFQNLRFLPKYIQLGWGEKGFYLDMVELENLTIPIAFRAALLPSESLMHVTYHGELPSKWYQLKEVMITKEQYLALIKYLKSGFQLKSERPIIVPGKEYYKKGLMVDNFYEGTGSYHLFNTCNMWTTRGMYEAGLKTSIFSPFKYGVSRFLE